MKYIYTRAAQSSAWVSQGDRSPRQGDRKGHPYYEWVRQAWETLLFDCTINTEAPLH